MHNYRQTVAKICLFTCLNSLSILEATMNQHIEPYCDPVKGFPTDRDSMMKLRTKNENENRTDSAWN